MHAGGIAGSKKLFMRSAGQRRHEGHKVTSAATFLPQQLDTNNQATVNFLSLYIHMVVSLLRWSPNFARNGQHGKVLQIQMLSQALAKAPCEHIV